MNSESPENKSEIISSTEVIKSKTTHVVAAAAAITAAIATGDFETGGYVYGASVLSSPLLKDLATYAGNKWKTAMEKAIKPAGRKISEGFSWLISQGPVRRATLQEEKKASLQTEKEYNDYIDKLKNRIDLLNTNLNKADYYGLGACALHLENNPDMTVEELLAEIKKVPQENRDKTQGRLDEYYTQKARKTAQEAANRATQKGKTQRQQNRQQRGRSK